MTIPNAREIQQRGEGEGAGLDALEVRREEEAQRERQFARRNRPRGRIQQRNPLEVVESLQPDRMYFRAPEHNHYQCRVMALDALALARRYAPKMSGLSASRLVPLWGDGFYGVRWQDPYVWWNESGTRPRTMYGLRGKIIPMWIDDPTGQERRKNPKARTRRTVSGKTQILIFRKASKPGTFKGGARRGAPRGSNLRWRHPGSAPRNFLFAAITQIGTRNGYIRQDPVYVTDRRW